MAVIIPFDLIFCRKHERKSCDTYLEASPYLFLRHVYLDPVVRRFLCYYWQIATLLQESNTEEFFLLCVPWQKQFCRFVSSCFHRKFTNDSFWTFIWNKYDVVLRLIMHKLLFRRIFLAETVFVFDLKLLYCIIKSFSDTVILRFAMWRSLTDIYSLAALLGNRLRCCVLCMEIKRYLVWKFESSLLLNGLYRGPVQTSGLDKRKKILLRFQVF